VGSGDGSWKGQQTRTRVGSRRKPIGLLNHVPKQGLGPAGGAAVSEPFRVARVVATMHRSTENELGDPAFG